MDLSDAIAALRAFERPWATCPNCKQPYQNQLSLDLSRECVSFALTAYGHSENTIWDKMKVLSSIHVRIAANSDFLIGALGHKNRWNVEIVRGEAKVQFELFFSLIDEIKNLLNMEGWEAMPRTSIEYQFYRFLRAYHEAFGLNQVGSWMIQNKASRQRSAPSKRLKIFSRWSVAMKIERGWSVY